MLSRSDGKCISKGWGMTVRRIFFVGCKQFFEEKLGFGNLFLLARAQTADIGFRQIQCPDVTGTDERSNVKSTATGIDGTAG